MAGITCQNCTLHLLDIYMNILPLFGMHSTEKLENGSQLSAARIVTRLPVFVFIEGLYSETSWVTENLEQYYYV